MAKKIKGVPLNLNKGGCTAISSNCVTWQGPDIPCLDLCKGSTVSEVIYNLGLEFCKLYEDLSPENYNIECLNLDDVCNLTFKDIFQALIDKVCAIQALSEGCNLGVKIAPVNLGFLNRTDGEGGVATFEVEVTNGSEEYTYLWEFVDNAQYFQITTNPTGSTVSFQIADLESACFTACATPNSSRFGLLKVTVVDAKGCIGTDTYLAISLLCG
jgi:hypothetical protein